MNNPDFVSRRDFVKKSLLAPAAISLAAGAMAQPATPAPAAAEGAMPMGQIGGLPISRLILGGNLISGWAHARDLGYVSTLMRRYNTEAKIRETLELAEANGINAINTYVMDDNTHIWNHWKRGGKMKWFAQVRLDSNGGYSQITKAADEGAHGIHINGDAAEGILRGDEYEKIVEMVGMIKEKKRIAGVAAHDLKVILTCVKNKLEVDFYQKTFHSHQYHTAPRADETGPMGRYDNSWCQDPQAVIDCMAGVKVPWIAFKILAAGAISPQAAFPYTFNSGADFALVGMFDWQVADNAKFARRVVTAVAAPGSKRTRPWCG
jgi:hypothetical protein